YGAPKKRGVMGSSLGGLMAYHQMMLDPKAYDFVASLSGTFGWDGDEMKARMRAQNFGPKNTKAVLYLDSGGSPGEDNYSPTLRMKQRLEFAGFTPGERLFYAHAVDAPHEEWAWAERVGTPVRIFESL